MKISSFVLGSATAGLFSSGVAAKKKGGKSGSSGSSSSSGYGSIVDLFIEPPSKSYFTDPRLKGGNIPLELPSLVSNVFEFMNTNVVNETKLYLITSYSDHENVTAENINSKFKKDCGARDVSEAASRFLSSVDDSDYSTYVTRDVIWDKAADSLVHVETIDAAGSDAFEECIKSSFKTLANETSSANRVKPILASAIGIAASITLLT